MKKIKKPRAKDALHTESLPTYEIKYTKENISGIESVLHSMRYDGLSCRQACLKAGVQKDTFLRWCEKDPELDLRYARAREALFDYWADQILEHSDDILMDPQRSRLMVDARKWILSKLAPKKYGDRIELVGDEKSPIALQALDVTRMSSKALKEIMALKDEAESE